MSAPDRTGSRFCDALKRDGESHCRRPAGWGTSHAGWGRCKLHGGASPSGELAASRQAAAHAVVTFGLPLEVDPHDALYEELARTNGHVAWLAQLIADLEQRGLKQYAVDGEGLRWERPAVWVELYQRERRHLTAVAKVCVDAGVDERRIRLAELQGQLVAGVIRAVLADLGVLDHPETPSIVRRHLEAASVYAAVPTSTGAQLVEHVPSVASA